MTNKKYFSDYQPTKSQHSNSEASVITGTIIGGVFAGPLGAGVGYLIMRNA